MDVSISDSRFFSLIELQPYPVAMMNGCFNLGLEPIKEKNLESEIETYPCPDRSPRPNNFAIKEKNLESEIETH